jgi:large subunit ribosomal protein L6
MSRIGKQPVKIPEGVTIQIEGNTIRVKGPKGELRKDFHRDMSIAVEGDAVKVTRPSDLPYHRALHGLTRTIVANMVDGVSRGFERSLQLVGVGYRASKSGKKLVLNVGYSHPVEIEPPQGIEFEVPNPAAIIVKGSDRETVGQITANIRHVRPPEVYKGKGIRYLGERVRHKVGKAGKK